MKPAIHFSYLGRYWRQIRKKGLFYWATVVILVVVGVLVGEWLEAKGFAIKQRYELYQFMTSGLTPNEAYAERTLMVTIDDNEFWTGSLARRLPLKRDYLARLLKTLKEADPTVIALDFDFRSPTPDGSLEDNPEYASETREFLFAIKEVSQRIPIVIPKTVGFSQGFYSFESDIYDGFDFGSGKVGLGHVLLPYDYRKVPLGVLMSDGRNIESFAQVIVGFDNREALKPIPQQSRLPFGYYLPYAQFPSVTAQQVLSSIPLSLTNYAIEWLLLQEYGALAAILEGRRSTCTSPQPARYPEPGCTLILSRLCCTGVLTTRGTGSD